MNRLAMLTQLARLIQEVHRPHPLRVAIDGVDAAGKTILADELAEQLHDSHRQIIRASVDEFHHPKAHRREKGSLSPEGFYYDSYDYAAVKEKLLIPLGPDGNRQYIVAIHDIVSEKPVVSEIQTASDTAILLMDGIFLLRPELLPWWDLTIYVHADFANTVPRGTARDANLYGSRSRATERYLERYVPGQQLYLQQVRPLDKADILINNNDIESPEILHIKPGLQKE
jgi:uridine kinase